MKKPDTSRSDFIQPEIMKNVWSWDPEKDACGPDILLPLDPLATSPETMCANEPYECKELLFWLQTGGGGGKDNVAKLTYDKRSISFKLTEINYLLAAITTIENQLARYAVAQNDVMSYVTTALGAQQYVQPRPDASTCILYDVLFDELSASL
jgi:hypothetical protein